jgi:hypothetical protein
MLLIAAAIASFAAGAVLAVQFPHSKGGQVIAALTGFV